MFTFWIPGLAWFALAVPLWLAAEALAGRSPVDWRGLGAAVGGHRAITAAIAVALLAIAAIAIGPAIGFVEKIDDVQASAGRLGSPVFWGEAFGIWPEGDFRIVRGEVSGSLLALALGALALGWGLVVAVRRRELALPVMLVAGGVVYVGARLFAEIHVEAKALAVIAPLALLVALRGLLGTPEREREQRGAGGRARSARAWASWSWWRRSRRRCWRCGRRRSATTRARPGSSASPRRSTAPRSPSSASIASPATTCAGR